MAKKDNRNIVALMCEECEERNYTTYKHKLMQEKLEKKKFCPKCGEHTLHIEKKVK
jgi:large subunit ribosomal protein L33